jgi:hypothetical protein
VHRQKEKRAFGPIVNGVFCQDGLQVFGKKHDKQLTFIVRVMCRANFKIDSL